MLLFASVAAAADLRFAGGIGFPGLLHAEVGWVASPRLSVEARYNFYIFNHLFGVGATGWLLGTPRTGLPPRHALIVNGALMVNPFAIGDGIEAGGERLPAALTTLVGWGYTADSGFQLTAGAGPVLYVEGGPAVGLDVQVGVGWAL